MPELKVYRHEICNANILAVEVGTNCPQGGDTGHGGRTVLRFLDLGGTDMSVISHDNPKIITLMFGGDSECTTLIEALEFALCILKGEMVEVK